MQEGTIRKRENFQVVGRWRADARAIVVETDDPDLRKAAGEILGRPQTIPVHGPERFEFAGGAAPLVETPSTIKFLALFALEMEERGFVVEPDEA